MISLVLFVIAIVAAMIHILCRKKTRTSVRIVEVFLGYLIPLCIGVMSFVTFIAQAFYGPQVATMMGWEPNSMFQFQLAIANLGFAIVGLLSIWQKKGFWLSTVLANAIFLLGCGWSHLSQLMNGTRATWHGFVFLYVNDIVVPIVLIVLTFVYVAKCEFFTERSRGQ